ncbi:hypothetical protein IH601_11340, partial [Candidatus Bipolaricaulota bacterium]|nr:hypothetical protein [Candidatus Bipolaricaulota bacterium]
MWLRTFEHGMWDIGIGSMFLVFGLAILVDFPALSAIWIAALIPSFREIGHKLILPRIGHVPFREPRKRAKGRLTGVLAATTVIGMGAFLFMFWLSKGTTPSCALWAGEHVVLFIGLIWGGALAITGWLVTLPRLNAYGCAGVRIIGHHRPRARPPLGLLARPCWRSDSVDRDRSALAISSALPQARRVVATGDTR